MFHIITRENAHLYGSALDGIFRLRYEYMIRRLGWDLPHSNGRQRDEQDRPETIYLAKLGDDGTVIGTAQYLPTALSRTIVGMVPPGLVGMIPRGPEIFEATRAVLREEYRSFGLMVEYCTAIAELACLFGFAQIIYVVEPSFHRTLVSIGWDVRAIGEVFMLNGAPFQVAALDVHRTTLRAVRTLGKTELPVVTYNRIAWPPP